MNINAATYYILNRLKKTLSEKLTYHNIAHTMDVFRSALMLAQYEKTSLHDQFLLKTAAFFHDAGFVNTYTAHEEESANIADEHLPKFNYSPEDITTIKNLILATKLPQEPQTHLEKILCDADLDYLGRPDYPKISICLFQEWQYYGIMDDPQLWFDTQLKFLKNHRYHTKTAKRMRQKGVSSIIKTLEEREKPFGF